VLRATTISSSCHLFIATPNMASAIPSSWSFNNPFRPSANPWTGVYQPPTATPAPPPATPVHPTVNRNTRQLRTRPYIQGRETYLGYVDDSHLSDSDDPDAPAHITYAPPPRRHHCADLHESTSGYVADHGPFLKPFNLNPGTWKEEDKLALEKGNYWPWAKKVYANIGLQSGATRWLDPNELCPSFDMYTRAHRTWQDNDVAIRSFLSLTCASSEHTYIEMCTSAADMWATIRTRHTKRGPLDQVNKLCLAMSIQFADDPDSWGPPPSTGFPS
jgi:hypothetical protein